MDFKPSPYQQAVRDFVSEGTGSAIIDAVAGSGKTTTIVGALELIPTEKSVLFLAFNKKIAEELQARVPKHVLAATFHSVAFKAYSRWFGAKVNVDANKCRQILRDRFSPAEQETYGAFVLRLVSVAKAAGVGILVPDTADSWQALADHYDISLDSEEADQLEGLKLASALLADSNYEAKECGWVDFDDMLYCSLLFGCALQPYDWVFVDESQDTNDVQRALLRRMLKPGGRLVAVGDPRQAIYGFRGAGADSMDQIRKDFSCRVLPLSISYRCAQSVVREAQPIVAHIEASPTAPEGEVIHGARLHPEGFTIGDSDDSSDFKATDAILCRNTAPLVSLAYSLIGRGVGCTVLGREIGAGLTALVTKLKAKGVDQLLLKLERFTERECASALAKGQEYKAEQARDKQACILAVVGSLDENHRTVPAVIASIERLFSDNRKGILTLATCHKSKGLEWNRVFIYRPELFPSKYARQEWQQLQEKNLLYVAITRAQKTLVYLNK